MTATILMTPMTGCGGIEDDGHLPIFYMNDYSNMGLRVDRLDDARMLLQNQSFAITETVAGIRVEISSPGRIPEICRMLQAQGIACSITDLVESVYQG
jgi:hypothetical protein